MDDLPIPSSQGNNSGSQVSDTPVGQSEGITIGKELEPVAGGGEQPLTKDVSGQEIELPKEVATAGVTTQPTTVVVPHNIAQMGVKPVGQMVMPKAVTTALPLTDVQIAQGLKQSITSSWRWLAEFCVRRLKQLHMTLKGISGKTMRANDKELKTQNSNLKTTT